MARLHTTGHSIRQIAARSWIARHRPFARELNRNGSTTQGYHPGYADQQARARRWQGSKLDRDSRSATRSWRGSNTAFGGGPPRSGAAPTGHFPRDDLPLHYAQMARKTEYSWRHYLPRAKAKRGRRCYKGRSPASFIALRRPLAERPAAVADRRTPGHWEADLMVFRIYGQAILTLHERHSRLLIAARPPGKAAAPMPTPSPPSSRPCPPRGAKRSPSITGRSLRGIMPSIRSASKPSSVRPTRPGKRAVENAIGRLRRTLPRKTDLATLSEEHFTRLIQVYNNTPRKCLGYQTPAEIFRNHLLHFKCDPPSCVREDDGNGRSRFLASLGMTMMVGQSLHFVNEFVNTYRNPSCRLAACTLRDEKEENDSGSPITNVGDNRRE